MKQKVAVVRREHFNAAHRLYRKDWSDAQNTSTFGKCSLPNFHGHNYELYVTIKGKPDRDTGFLYDAKKLSNIIKENVLQRFDHKNLNLDTEYFRNVNPTAENICVVIYNILREKIDKRLEMQVRLYETERNFVEYPVSQL